MLSLGELAARLGLPIGDADPDVVVSGIGTLADAGPSQLAFVAERRYLDTLEGTSAACVLLRPEWAELSPVPVLCTDDPYLAYARASALFDEAPCPQPGIDPRAAVADDVSLGVGVSIGPGACVEAGRHWATA
jgi:UDP-3-O-[3-hydroxymyristoyl] glucosamine N-acyltransferase